MSAQTKYASKTADEICRLLASGESLNAICTREGMPARRTVQGWISKDVEGFVARLMAILAPSGARRDADPGDGEDLGDLV